ncbi:MAG: hypothetical protein CVU57_29690 [Deltaproteobacteria bacterium HGW-Deltaproteobacteria-15]|nr:MAG: hypothetical protein CVU57_29690 [Deltaproteobacteria bacterium HGW-Deltaproteobacteria-15]
MKRTTRRGFMKNLALAGAAAAVLPTIWVPKTRAAWFPKTSVHPHVDNLRVVAITDPAMTTPDTPGISWARQEDLVNRKAVWEDMDRLACGLVQTDKPEEAWKGLFIKPPRKPWSDTVLAIKTNHISQQHTRSAVMSKVCHVAVDILGVKAGNIHIYDACHGSSISKETPFRGLPEGTRIENTWGGSNTSTSIPHPWENGNGESGCVEHLVKGTVDILVNIALCKGHSPQFGGFTMTMKNHFGTFDPGPGHRQGSLDYLLAINRTPEILGTMDPHTGKVQYPRQQLCIIDGLWASKHGPSGNPSHQANFMAMGVFSPAVDYLIASRFRAERMGWKVNMNAARRMLTDFGYSEGDLPQGGKLIEI